VYDWGPSWIHAAMAIVVEWSFERSRTADAPQSSFRPPAKISDGTVVPTFRLDAVSRRTLPGQTFAPPLIEGHRERSLSSVRNYDDSWVAVCPDADRIHGGLADIDAKRPNNCDARALLLLLGLSASQAGDQLFGICEGIPSRALPRGRG